MSIVFRFSKITKTFNWFILRDQQRISTGLYVCCIIYISLNKPSELKNSITVINLITERLFLGTRANKFLFTVHFDMRAFGATWHIKAVLSI